MAVRDIILSSASPSYGGGVGGAGGGGAGLWQPIAFGSQLATKGLRALGGDEEVNQALEQLLVTDRHRRRSQVSLGKQCPPKHDLPLAFESMRRFCLLIFWA